MTVRYYCGEQNRGKSLLVIKHVKDRCLKTSPEYDNMDYIDGIIANRKYKDMPVNSIYMPTNELRDYLADSLGKVTHKIWVFEEVDKGLDGRTYKRNTDACKATWQDFAHWNEFYLIGHYPDEVDPIIRRSRNEIYWVVNTYKIGNWYIEYKYYNKTWYREYDIDDWIHSIEPDCYPGIHNYYRWQPVI